MSEFIILSGVLSDPAGVPVAGAKIVITAHRTSTGTLKESVTTTTTSDKGDYCLSLLPGGYTVTVVWPGNVRPQVLGRITVELGGPSASLNDYLLNADDFYSDKVVFNSIKSLADDSMIAAALAKSSRQLSEHSADAAAQEKALATAAAATAAIGAESADISASIAESARDEAIAATRASSFAELRSIRPTSNGQRLRLRGWNEGTDTGGGDFTGYLLPGVDDGGLVAAGSEWHWQRVISDENNLNITHFGAVEGGVIDCSFAALAMHKWAHKNDSTDSTVGIRLPAGKFKISKIDLSDSYISYFKVTGDPVSFGYFSSTTIVSDRTDGVIFNVNARYVEISNIIIDGECNIVPNTVGFFKNSCIGGTFFRGACIRARYLGGRCLELLDTLDTKISQFYATHCSASFLRARWSDREAGVWDHSTAIQLSNFNMQQCTREPIFDLERCGQSLIINGWIEHSEFPGDLSNGQWLVDCLSIEDCINPMRFAYCRPQFRQLNLQSGSTISFDTTGKESLLSRFEQGWRRDENFGT